MLQLCCAEWMLIFNWKLFLLKPGLPLYRHWICLVHWTRVSILIFLSPLPFSNHWENHHFHTWPIDHHHDHHFNQATNPRRRACRLGNRGESRTNHLPWDGDQDLRDPAEKAEHKWVVLVFVSNTWVWSCWIQTQVGGFTLPCQLPPQPGYSWSWMIKEFLWTKGNCLE